MIIQDKPNSIAYLPNDSGSPGTVIGWIVAAILVVGLIYVLVVALSPTSTFVTKETTTTHNTYTAPPSVPSVTAAPAPIIPNPTPPQSTPAQPAAPQAVTPQPEATLAPAAPANESQQQ